MPAFVAALVHGARPRPSASRSSSGVPVTARWPAARPGRSRRARPPCGSPSWWPTRRRLTSSTSTGQAISPPCRKTSARSPATGRCSCSNRCPPPTSASILATDYPLYGTGARRSHQRVHLARTDEPRADCSASRDPGYAVRRRPRRGSSSGAPATGERYVDLFGVTQIMVQRGALLERFEQARSPEWVRCRRVRVLGDVPERDRSSGRAPSSGRARAAARSVSTGSIA